MNRLRLTAPPLLAAAVVLLAPETARAFDVFWNGSSSGAWNTANNWEDETGFAAVPDGDSPFFDQAYIANGDTVVLNQAAQNNIDALFIGGQTDRDDVDYGTGGLTVTTGGSLSVTDTGGAFTSGLLQIGRVPSLSAPAGVTSADVQEGALTITGAGSVSVADRLFLQRRSNVNPMLTLQDSASIAVGGDADLRGTARIVGPDVNFTANTLQFGGLLRLIPELTAPTHSPIQVTGVATLNSGSTVAPEFSGAPVSGDRYTLVDAAAITNNGVQLDSSQVALADAQSLRLFVDRNGPTEQLKLAVDDVLTLTANRATGELSIDNTHGSAISIKGYSIQSPNGYLDPSNGAWISLDDLNVDGGTWNEANPNVNALNELNLTNSRAIAGGSNTTFGTPYNLTEIGTTDDLVFTYQNDAGETLTGVVEYTGGINSLVLRVDPSTGNAVLTNESQFDADINGYSITSGDGTGGSGSLLTSYDSLQKQLVAGWSEANTSSEALNELNLEGSALLTTGESIALDGLWDTSGNQDLELQFALLGGSGSVDGVVLYESILAGDYNFDGVVDAADYTVWRDGNSPDSSPAGYTVWANNFGATSSSQSSSSSTSVPEPTGLLMLGAMLLCARLGQRTDWAGV